MSDMPFLADPEWHALLREVHDQQVIPIVGPQLITVVDPDSGEPISPYRSLASKLAQALGVSQNRADEVG